MISDPPMTSRCLCCMMGVYRMGRLKNYHGPTKDSQADDPNGERLQ
jgi:hypothetical protein